MLKKLKKQLFNKFIKKVFSPIEEKDIIEFLANGQVKVKGKLIEQEEKEALSVEANKIIHSEAWKLVVGTMKNEAKDKIFNKSTAIEEMYFPKAVLYEIDVLEKVLARISKLK